MRTSFTLVEVAKQPPPGPTWSRLVAAMLTTGSVMGVGTGCAGPQEVVWPSGPVTDTVASEIALLESPVKAPLVDGQTSRLTAYRPCHNGFGEDMYAPFQVETVPEAGEENPSIGIRINGDDDNGNGVPDRDEGNVAGEDDLIEVRLEISPRAPADTGFVVLRRSDPALRVWRDQGKGDELVFDDGYACLLDRSAGTSRLWVEWTGRGHGSAALEIEESPADGTGSGDRLVFRTFRGLVICLGGLDGKSPHDRGGIYHIAQLLYRQGYDTYMYKHDDWTKAVEGAKAAITSRSVTEVAAIGHSAGALAVRDLTRELNDWRADTGAPFDLTYTAYVDGNLFFAVDRAPQSAYHVNLYQRRGFLRGARVEGEPGSEVINFDVTSWDKNMNHMTIDNHALVHAAIIFGRAPLLDGVLQRVDR